MDVSIIIVNWNTRALLVDCLRSIGEKVSGISYETIVVDNASSDGSAEAVRGEFSGVTVLESGENLGFGRANNLGASVARGDYLFFLNSDTVLLNDAVSVLFGYLKVNPQCGIVGGNLTDGNGVPIHSHSLALPSPFTDLTRLVPRFQRLRYGNNWTYNHTERPMRVAYVTGADMMMPRSLFEELGGFDPAFFMYYEETELTSRVRNRGYSVYSVPQARITHFKGGSLENMDSVKEVVYTSKYLYMKKVHGDAGVWLAHASFCVYCRIKGFLTGMLGKKKSAARYSEMLHIAATARRNVH